MNLTDHREIAAERQIVWYAFLNPDVLGESLTLSGQGKGGPAGFTSGSADVRLRDINGGRLLEYDLGAKVGDKLVQLGSRIIVGFPKKLAGQFFERFQEGLEPDAAEIADATDQQETKKDGSGACFLHDAHIF